ncbi:MAG: T9SS type A sorting domain-containing protein, partial [Bacteroidetes bacterium]|nr:T9SS type A sorting domain-containing protein [Bacteroidota bacterium]
EGAIDITSIINSCSADAAYTTIGGSADKNKGSTWNTGANGNYNRWFKFTASAATINATVDIGGAKGSQRRSQIAIWESDGTNEVASKRYVSDSEDITVGVVNLTPGNLYYISVDAYAGYYGTFTLCLDDVVDYDYFEGAVEITDINAWCSDDAAYTTIGGSADKTKGSCWNTGANGNYNRWFKFVAQSSDVTITVDIGGAKGTQRRSQLALWESDGSTQLDCQRYAADADDVSLSYSGLVTDNTYYISIDAYAGYYGTFTLCVDNIDEEYFSIADGNWNNLNTWSIVDHTGPPAASVPQSGDVVNIRGHEITVSGAQETAGLNMVIADDNTKLTINNAALTVRGKMEMTNSGENFTGQVVIQGSGNLIINDNALFTRGGGDSEFSVKLENSATLTVEKTMTWTSSAGTSADSELSLENTASVVVTDDCILDYSGGEKILFSAENDATISILRDLTLSSTAADKTNISLNDDSELKIGRNIVRGDPAYGNITCNDDSRLSFETNRFQQTIGATGGDGGDGIQIENLTINNTAPASPQVTLTGLVEISGNLTLTNGIIATTEDNILVIKDNATISGGSETSYIDGPLKKIGNDAFVFPVGDDGYFAQIAISAPGNATAEFVAEYIAESPDDRESKEESLVKVSGVEYWDLDRNTGTSPADDVFVTLYWADGSRSGIEDIVDLTVAHFDGSQWEDKGNGSTTGDESAGSITSEDKWTSFSGGTLGTKTPDNPLPITLVRFTARLDGTARVLIFWETSSEKNNNYFDVEKSSDGINFEAFATVPGAGNSNSTLKYDTEDTDLSGEIVYYRLKQVDYNGDYSYSNIAAIRLAEEAVESDCEMNVNPNPCIGKCYVVFQNCSQEEMSEVNISIFDGLGNQVFASATKTIEQGESSFVIDSENNYKPAVYIVRGSVNNQQYSKKVIIKN